MDKKKLLHLGIVIVIAIALLYMIFTFIQKHKEKQFNQLQQEQHTIELRVDSIRIINNYLDSLNKKDGVQVNQTKKNISDIDSIIANSSIRKLQDLLNKHTK